MSIKRPIALYSGDLREVAVGDYPVSGGTINSYYTDYTTSGTSSETLIEEYIPAGLLAHNGDMLEVEYFGTFAATGGSKQVSIDFDGNSIISQTTSQNGGEWVIRARLVRSSATSVRCVGVYGDDTPSTDYIVSYLNISSITLSNPLLMSLVGQTSASAGDLTARGGSIRFTPHPPVIVTVGGAAVTNNGTNVYVY